MTRSMQQKSSRSSVKFALKAHSRGKQQQNQSEDMHGCRTMCPGWSRPASPTRRRSRSSRRDEAHDPGRPERCNQPDREIGTSKDSEQGHGPRWHCFELKYQLDITTASLSNVEKHMAELKAGRAIAEEQAQAAHLTLESIKERRSDFHKRLQAAVTTSQQVLGNAKAAVNSAEAKIELLIQDAEREAATLAIHTKAKKDTIAATEAHIFALEAANPGLGTVAMAANIDEATCDSGLKEVEAPPVVPSDIMQAAEERWTAMEAKLAYLKEKRASALAVFASRGGKVGELASRAIDIEAGLGMQRETVSQLQSRAKKLGVDEDSQLEALALRVSGPSAPTRKPSRLIALSSSLPEIAGEYKLLPDAVSDRPAYAHKASGAADTYLFWSSAGGRRSWTLARELPGSPPGAEAAATDAGGAEQGGLLARSAQDAWTALPDELASSRWEAGSRVVDITLISIGA